VFEPFLTPTMMSMAKSPTDTLLALPTLKTSEANVEHRVKVEMAECLTTIAPLHVSARTLHDRRVQYARLGHRPMSVTSNGLSSASGECTRRVHTRCGRDSGMPGEQYVTQGGHLSSHNRVHYVNGKRKCECARVQGVPFAANASYYIQQTPTRHTSGE